jgi:hypothetical protein
MGATHQSPFSEEKLPFFEALSGPDFKSFFIEKVEVDPLVQSSFKSLLFFRQTNGVLQMTSFF